jgi:hypothetical protein
MTAEKLTRLAEQAATVAGYFAATDPAYARRYPGAAIAAGKLGAEKLTADLARENAAPPLGCDLTANATLLVGGPEVA